MSDLVRAARLLPVVVGPTASGKTELAIRLAETLRGEILSADSVQVYRHFELGTGKPSHEERARAAHHLIDITEPEQGLDAASWAERAARLIDELWAAGKTPIVCGGSFLWVRALLYGLAPAPPSDPAIRERHRRLVEDEGRSALHARLAAVDPESAERLSPNDTVRVSRALEVFELCQIPLGTFHAKHRFQTPRYRFQLISVRRARDELDRRIAERARKMFESGWIEEVQTLRERGYGATRPMGSVGYRQIADALAQASPGLDREAVLSTVVRATRVFARRQRTWLRDQPQLLVDPDSPSELQSVCALLER